MIKTFELFSNYISHYPIVEDGKYKIHLFLMYEQFTKFLFEYTNGDLEQVKPAMAHNKQYYDMYTEDGSQFVIIEDTDTDQIWITHTTNPTVTNFDDDYIPLRSLPYDLKLVLAKLYQGDYTNNNNN